MKIARAILAQAAGNCRATRSVASSGGEGLPSEAPTQRQHTLEAEVAKERWRRIESQSGDGLWQSSLWLLRGFKWLVRGFKWLGTWLVGGMTRSREALYDEERLHSSAEL